MAGHGETIVGLVLKIAAKVNTNWILVVGSRKGWSPTKLHTFHICIIPRHDDLNTFQSIPINAERNS